jgi:hypothetical protein
MVASEETDFSAQGNPILPAWLKSRIRRSDTAPGMEVKNDPAPVYWEASELVDDHTCEACAGVDGRVYENLGAAESDYGPGGSGGYVRCEAGPNCRGTLVAVYPEQNAMCGKGPLGEAGPPT